MKVLGYISLLCLTTYACGQGSLTEEKPNILVMLTDQQTFFTMKTYGNQLIQTPALDELAETSYVFQNAYVTQPVCAPSRASIVTGLYPHTHGVIDNNHPLSKEIATLPELLGEEYQSAYIGKWHLGDEVFKQRGFETWVSMEDGYQEEFSAGRDVNQRSDYHHWLLERGYKPDKKGNRFSRGFAASLPIEHCKPTFLKEKAIDFLADVGDDPFLMYVSFLEPHKPYTGPLDSLYDPADIILPGNFEHELGENDPLRYRHTAASDREKFGPGEQGYKELIARYWGLVSQVDLSIKAILDQLKSLKLDENTIVVFTSDHGSMMGAHGMVSKDVMYEESARVPFILRAPQLSKQQTIINDRVSLIDLVPTLLDLSDEKIPTSLQGQSLIPFLKGERQYNRDVMIEWTDIRTIVTHDGWKMALIENDKSLLFDLNNDPLETRNLFYREESKEIIAELTEKIRQWQLQTNDTYSLATNPE
ncbi:MAG: sulfatase-like hydrolase/transferase [Bacteroidota bacterium]